MTKYLYLSAAILFEVLGTFCLPLTQGFTRLVPTVGMGVSYALAFFFLSLTLKELPLAIVYATWSGIGVFLIALLGFVVLKQTLEWQEMLGLAFIVFGVVLVHAHSQAH